MGKIKLKKDIVIPAGTTFDEVNNLKVEYGRENYEHIFGLTKESSGALIYGIDRSDSELEDWFEDCE